MPVNKVGSVQAGPISPVAIVCFAVILVLVVLGIKTFTLNEQAWTLWQENVTPVDALLSGHPHGTRYLVYYPVFAMAQFMGVAPDVVFSYFCAGLLFLMAFLSGEILLSIWGEEGHFWRHGLIVAAIFALSLVMNGRLILAYSGYLLIAFSSVSWFAYRRWTPANVIYLAFGCLLASVSSGTLLVAMSLVAALPFIIILRDRQTLLRTPLLPASVMAVLVMFLIPALIGIDKNLQFYGGDDAAIIRMLSHGAGGEIASSFGVEVAVTAPADHDSIVVGVPDGGLQNLLGAEVVEMPSDHDSIVMVVPDEEDQSLLGGGFIWEVAKFWWAGIVGAWVLACALGWRPILMVSGASPQENVIHMAIMLPSVGGLFGYSVLSMTILPMLIFVSGRARPAYRYLRHRFGPGPGLL